MNEGRDPGAPNGSLPAGAGGIQWKRILLGLLVVVLLVIVFQNSQSVTVKLLFLETSMPLIVILVITALLGAAVGYLIPAVRQRHRTRG